MQDIGKEDLKEPVPALDRLCDLLSLPGQARTPVRFVVHEVLLREALERLGYARRCNLEALCNRRGLCGAFCTGDIVDRFEIFLNLFLRHPDND